MATNSIPCSRRSASELSMRAILESVPPSERIPSRFVQKLVPIAAAAPQPPSFVALPPRPKIIFFAPVPARAGSVRQRHRSSCGRVFLVPDQRQPRRAAISTTVVRQTGR
jgi:hypothetical protein